MDWVETKDIVTTFFRKYRWAALVLLAGVVLMAFPEGNQREEEVSASEPALQAQMGLQQELEEILSRLDGAGKVQVLLTQSAGEQTWYQTDENISKTAETGDKRTQTVILTGSDREEKGLVQRIDPPVYLGAVVLCQGADSAAVRLAIVDAVGTATGLTSDKISVLKMK